MKYHDLINFTQFRIDEQEVRGPVGDYMTGYVDFDLTVRGHTYRDLSTRVKATVGQSFGSPGSYEVELPAGDLPEFDYAKYRDCIATYIDRLVSEKGDPFSIHPDANRIRLEKIRLEYPWSCHISDEYEKKPDEA